MSEVSKGELNELVARVTEQVLKETQSGERAAFGVADLRGQLSDMAKVGGASAWTISYSTSSGAVRGLQELARPGGDAAWTISYSTSSGAIQGLAEST